jgi:hypothetical protein
MMGFLCFASTVTREGAGEHAFTYMRLHGIRLAVLHELLGRG